MEQKFTNENMEEFLKRNTESLLMRPSERVWLGISKHLNRRRTIGTILGSSFLLICLLGYYISTQYSPSGYQTQNTVQNKVLSGPRATAVQHNGAPSLTPAAPLALSRQTTRNSTAQLETTAAGLPDQQEFVAPGFEPTVTDEWEINEPEPSPLSGMRPFMASDPLTIESVVNTYRARARKMGWQVYFTPAVSYRKLTDTVDHLVTHKPAFGFEVGVAAKYAVSKAVKVKAGLQFNVNRYAIRTHDGYMQPTTIRINDGNRVNYVNTFTSYNNVAGKPVWLQNSYFQVSAPVGVEFRLAGDDKVQFGMGTTFQPTYVIGDKAYLISSDLKNYAEMPKLVRKWNVNTSLETYIEYSTGHLKWQVGPQVRYQMLSSFLHKYPVKENLFDFGLKVGISPDK